MQMYKNKRLSMFILTFLCVIVYVVFLSGSESTWIDDACSCILLFFFSVKNILKGKDSHHKYIDYDIVKEERAERFDGQSICQS